VRADDIVFAASAETVEMQAVKLESEGDVQQAKEQ
jgi:hypothetical protein